MVGMTNLAKTSVIVFEIPLAVMRSPCVFILRRHAAKEKIAKSCSWTKKATLRQVGGDSVSGRCRFG